MRERDRQRLLELEAKEAARQERAKLAWEYFQAAHCACTAAERYVPSCSKHGSEIIAKIDALLSPNRSGGGDAG